MRVFVTGATGFIGSAVVPELITAGHQVLGLARSEAGAAALTAAGAEALRGTMEDPEILRKGAENAGGVIHLAFNHDFSKFAANGQVDKVAIDTLGAVLAGSDRALVVTGGIAMIANGRVANENDVPPPNPHLPRVSEATADALAAQGVRAMTMRLPQVHDTTKQGLVTYLIAMAREKGVSAYVDGGMNRYPAAHVLDVARLYRLALEKGTAGAHYHAVDEEGVSLKDIAEAIGRGLKLPVAAKSGDQIAGHFGWMAMFAGMDCPASSALTQQWLGWQLSGQPGIIADLDNMDYSKA